MLYAVERKTISLLRTWQLIPTEMKERKKNIGSYVNMNPNWENPLNVQIGSKNSLRQELDLNLSNKAKYSTTLVSKAVRVNFWCFYVFPKLLPLVDPSFQLLCRAATYCFWLFLIWCMCMCMCFVCVCVYIVLV